MDIKFKFGQTIRRLRKERGITQEKLGEISGLHTSYIGGMERGERNPSLISIYKITQALELSLSDAFAFVEEPQLTRETPLPYITALPQEDAEFIREFVQKLLEWKKGSP